MKVVILAGGLGSRLSEETETKPKPMVEIGEAPILWHIMRHYAHFGHDHFVIALGYKGEVIKRYVIDQMTLGGNVRVDFGARALLRPDEEVAVTGDWVVELVETGLRTNNGGRVKRLAKTLGGERFLLTWGDGVSDVDLDALLRFHVRHGRLATLTAVRPPARFGHLQLDGARVDVFDEKPQAAEGWINGAFFVLEPEVLDYIDGDDTQFEREPLQRLARDGQLMAFKHEGFWQCMDTLRDKKLLDRIWASGEAPWRVDALPPRRPRSPALATVRTASDGVRLDPRTGRPGAGEAPDPAAPRATGETRIRLGR
jgi:glucose-1-phosphate cytidylyltransferase